MKLTKVIIGGVTIKDTDGGPDPAQLISWEYEKEDESISEAELILPKSVNDLVDLTNGQVVEIHGGWTTSTDKRLFYGFIDDIKPDGAILKVLCKNEMISLVRQNVNHVYDSSIDASAGEVSEIVEDLIETFGGMNGTVQSSGTEDGKRIDQFKCVNTDVFERIMTLKKALDWDLFYEDNTRVVFFQPLGYTDSGITLTVGTTIIEMPEWDIDDSNMINDLRVDGASVPTDLTETGKIGTDAGYTTTSILLTNTPDTVELYMDAATLPTTQKTGGSKDSSSGHFYYVDKENKKIIPATGTTFTTDHYSIVNYTWYAQMPIHMVNQASIDSYKVRKKTMEFNDITSVADAESRAASILAKRSLPFISGKIKVKSEVANIPNRGDLISIVDTKTPTVNGQVLSGNYVVNKIKYIFPSAFEELEVGDKKWRLADWQQTTEERLKRLEEQFVRNQDILVELIDIQNFSSNENALKPQSRYFKTITEAYDVSNDRMIWDNADHGVWDNDKWGDGTDTFESEVTAFMMQAENLYTEDFIDDDFEGAGNATWSTTGSVTFTAGQIALSLPIDKNNGTITTATLTATEVSGSFDYEMNAVNSLKSHYFMNDNAANTIVLDDIGLNNGVSNSNTDTMDVVGKINNALEFNGTTDLITISTNTPINEIEGSISCWVKFNVISKDQIIFISGESAADGETGSEDEIYIKLIGADNKIEAGWRTAAEGDVGVSNDAITTGVWIHIILRWSTSDNEVALWVNNVKQTTKDVFTNDNKDNWQEEIRIGRAMGSAANTNYFDGILDDFRIYNKALSSGERDGVYNSGSGTESNSNWESVTSGTAHTFSNTGAELLWRATENAASTGEISKIIIGEYH